MLIFADREYRPSRDELERLADILEQRAAAQQAGVFRRRGDDTRGPLAARIRASVGPPEAVLELESHEAAALLLVCAEIGSPELDRFITDYIAEHDWTRRPLSAVSNTTRGIGSLLALQIGRWFFEDALETPIGEIDENGDDLPPDESAFAALAGANTAFADVATAWARLNSSLAEQSLRTDDVLAWIRREREQADATLHTNDVDEHERARAAGRAWALREAGLWIETAANRSRPPWEPPRHQA